MLNKEKIGKKVGSLANNAKNITMNVSEKTKQIVTKSKDKVVDTMDANGDGNIDIEDVIILGLKTPGIKINRSEECDECHGRGVFDAEKDECLGTLTEINEGIYEMEGLLYGDY